MAVVTNTFVTTDAVGNREELHNVVSRIDPEETPLYSMSTRVSFKTTHPEWETDSLSSAGQNAHAEGEVYNFAAIEPAVKLGNYTQIFNKTGIVSGSQDAMDNAGNHEKLKEQKLKRGIELRRDVEYSILAANASVGGSDRRSGSLSTWITTNVSRGGGGGANGGYNSGTGLTVAPTNGTQRAFTKALMDDVMQQAAISGAKLKHICASYYVKSVFATFMSDSNVAAFRTATDGKRGNTLVATVDIYQGPHGKVMFHENVVQSQEAGLARNVFFVDPEFVEWGWYRRIKEDKDIARTSDANHFVLIGEGALKVKNEKGLGVVADVYGLSAST